MSFNQNENYDCDQTSSTQKQSIVTCKLIINISFTASQLAVKNCNGETKTLVKYATEVF